MEERNRRWRHRAHKREEFRQSPLNVALAHLHLVLRFRRPGQRLVPASELGLPPVLGAPGVPGVLHRLTAPVLLATMTHASPD